MTRTDLPGSPGLGNAYRSVKSRRASPRGNTKWARSNGATCSGFVFLCAMGHYLRNGGTRCHGETVTGLGSKSTEGESCVTVNASMRC